MNEGRANFTKHALDRMSRRHIGPNLAETVIAGGREIHTHGATVYFVGRDEVERNQRSGMDWRPLEGLCVVCSREGAVLTVYRNRNLRRLKRCKRGRNYRREAHGSHFSQSKVRRSSQSIGCYDNEDIEGWLVEEGIGYFDESGIFHYGTSPKQHDIDLPIREEVEE